MLDKCVCLMFEAFGGCKKKTPLTGVHPSVLYVATSDGLMWLMRQTVMSGKCQRTSSVFCESVAFRTACYNY